MPLALVTGASRGLGHALAHLLAKEGWDLVLDARDGDALRATAPARAVVVPGDVGDALHREALRAAVVARGPLDLLVHNASTLGPTPLPRLAELAPEALRSTLEVNVVAPLALTQLLLPHLRGAVVAITSDAATGAYEGWGGYGASKAALEQLMAVLAVEHPQLRVSCLDPGEMQTGMLAAACPGEDLSDRALPASVAPAVLRLLDLPSGRYVAADLLAGVGR